MRTNDRAVRIRETISSLLFVSLLLLAVFGGRALTRTVESRVSELRDVGIAEIEAATAQTLSWESVSPSIVRGITVYGVKISDNATAERVSVRFNLLSLLWGDPRDLIPEVTIDRPEAIIVTAEHRRNLEQTLDFVSSNAEGRRDLVVRVRRGTLTASDDAGEITLRSVSGDIALQRNRLTGALSTEAYVATDIDGERFTVSSRIVAEIDGARDGPELNANIELRDNAGSHFTMTDRSFRLERRASRITVEQVRSNDPLDLSLFYDDRERTISVEMTSDDYLPRETVTLQGPWARHHPWLSTRVDGNASFAVSLDDGFLESSGNVTAYSTHPELPEPVTVTGRYAMSPQEVVFDQLTARTTDGSATFRGSYRFGNAAPNGTVSLRNFRYGEKMPVLTGDAVISGTTGGAGLSSESLAVSGIRLYQVVAGFTPGDRYSSLRVAADMSSDRSERIEMNARFRDMEDFNAELRMRDVAATRVQTAAAAFGRTVSLPPVVNESRLSGLIRLDRRNGDTFVGVPYFTMRDEESGERVAGVSGTYRNGTVVIDQFTATVGINRIHAEGFVRFGSAGTIDFRTDLTVNALTYPLRGTYATSGSLTVLGPDGVEVRIESAGVGIRIDARLQEVPIPIGAALVSAHIEGLYYSADDWYLNAREMEIVNLPAVGGGTSELSVSAGLQPGYGQLSILSYEDSTSRLAGSFRFSYLFEKSPDIQVNGSIASFDTNEQYRISARYTGSDTAVDVRFSDSPVDRFMANARSGTAGGTLQAVGPPEDPEIRLFLETSEVRINSQDADMRLLAYIDSEELRISNSQVSIGTTEFTVTELRAARASGEIRGDVHVVRKSTDRRYEVSLTGTTAPIDQLNPAVLVRRPLSAEIDVYDTERSTSPGADIGSLLLGLYRLERTDEATFLRREDDALEASIDDDGGFEMILSDPFPVTFQASGTLRRDDVELTLSGVVADLPEISRLVDLQGLAVQSGEARGSLRLLGTPADPDLFGTLSVNELSATTPVGPDTVGPVEATIIFQERMVRMPQITAQAGAATVVLSAQALLDRLTIEQYQASASVSGEQGLRVNRSFGPVNVDGYARGEVSLEGTTRETRLRGNVFITSTEISIQDTEPRDPTRNRRSFVLDLDVETGRAVQFIWPDRDFPILRSNFATGQSVSIQADTREQQFSIVGDLEIQSGDVFYFDRSFLIRNGQVAFNEDQDDFDPRLTARAELREVTPEGPVRIYLIADGQRLSEFSPRFESNPPLGGSEIVAILGGNIFEQAGSESVNLATALLSTSDVVTQFGVFRQFEDAVREQLDLDLFAIRTSVIQNVLLSAVTPVGGTEPAVAPSLGSYLDNTSIFMGRYLGDSVFGQAVVQLRSQDMQDPFQDDPGIQRLGGVLIDSEISLEWQTPFFLLEWNFAPQNPEELFIRDNTFTFSWLFSY
ncbi:MAG: translocation/assembly module TamB domain-containing protein [Alkalispirochaeta sp.]